MSENGCVHLNNFKAAKGIQPYRTVHSFFVSSTSSEARRNKSRCCYCYICRSVGPRLHSCFHCVFFGCYRGGHIQDHAKMKKHFLAVDLSYGNIFCFQCADYVYDIELLQMAKEQREKSYVSLGMTSVYKPWVPSKDDVDLFKDNPRRRKIVRNTTIGLRGLLNLGSTCFMNCIVQALTHIPLLRDFFLSEQHVCRYRDTPELCLVCEVARLFQEFYSGNKTPLALQRMLQLVWTQAEHMAGYKQQDAHEFLMATLDLLHKQTKSNSCPPPAPPPGAPQPPPQAASTNPNNCSCIIDQIFTGGLQSDVTCQACNGVSTTIDPFWDISLELGNIDDAPAPGLNASGNDNNSSQGSMSSSQSSHSSGNGEGQSKAAAGYSGGSGSGSSANNSGPLSLVECLEQFTRAEHLGSDEIKCSNCDTYQQSTKQLTVQKLPIVACFHLKRFEHSSKFQKISKIIAFPVELDMTPFMSRHRNNNNSAGSSNGQNGFQPNVMEDNRYSLFAVVNHTGTPHNGHYTAFIRQQHDEWFKCDDHMVTRATLNDVLDSEGYLLFYHKQILEYE